MTQPAPDAVVVRPLRPTDDPGRLRALRLEMLADTPIAYAERYADAAGRPAQWWTERLHRYATDERARRFVAESAGAWVGQAGGSVESDGRAWLVGVYVAPAYRGSGLLERLVDEVTSWLVSLGTPQVYLEVAEANGRARAAYTRLGFRATGRTQEHPIFAEHTEMEMVLDLR